VSSGLSLCSSLIRTSFFRLDSASRGTLDDSLAAGDVGLRTTAFADVCRHDGVDVSDCVNPATLVADAPVDQLENVHFKGSSRGSGDLTAPT
jgi:hypothetical protein